MPDINNSRIGAYTGEVSFDAPVSTKDVSLDSRKVNTQLRNDQDIKIAKLEEAMALANAKITELSAKLDELIAQF